MPEYWDISQKTVKYIELPLQGLPYFTKNAHKVPSSIWFFFSYSTIKNLQKVVGKTFWWYPSWANICSPKITKPTQVELSECTKKYPKWSMNYPWGSFPTETTIESI